VTDATITWGVEAVNEAAYREILRRLGVEPARGGPQSDGSADPVPLRVAAFRRQLEAWVQARWLGIPLLALSGVEGRDGTCIGCGETLAADRLWRCVHCEQAVRLVLGMPERP
jgi:hypothetical protein